MYSKKKGKSGSKKPVKKTKQSWIRYDTKEVEQLILKLARAGKTASQIGLILRDRYGIPNVNAIVKKKITKVLEENNLKPKLPEDLLALIKKSIRLMKHLEINKKDMPVRRGLQLTESKIKRLSKYYKKINRLPKEWKYSREKAKLLIE